MPEKRNDSGTSGNSGGTRKYDNTKRRWFHPGKRAERFASERKSGVYQNKKKEGQQLTEYDKGVRSGYLLARSDEAGMFKYKQALEYGMSPDDAAAISRRKGK